MADIGMHQIRVLGFAPLAGLDALLAAMDAVPGPDSRVLRAPVGTSLVAIFQTEPEVPLAGRGRQALAADLLTVQRRLEIACQAGAFLPMDPAAACCPAAALPRLLAADRDALAAALACHGARHQWDIVLQWTPEAVLARRRAEIAPAASLGPYALADAVAAVLRRERSGREAALLTALAPAVLEFAADGAACTETVVAVTVLVRSGSEAAVEAALDAMAPEHLAGASIDMRGPMPPLSFASVRLETVDGQSVTDAWHTLGLFEQVDLSALHRNWRMRAAEAHPDRHPGAVDATVSELTDAYRLLRDLLPRGNGPDRHTLSSLLRRSGHRLAMPADGPRPVSRTDADVRKPVLEPIS